MSTYRAQARGACEGCGALLTAGGGFDTEGRRVCETCAGQDAIEQSVRAARENPPLPGWAVPASLGLGAVAAVVIAAAWLAGGAAAAVGTAVAACTAFLVGAVVLLRVGRRRRR